MRILYLHQYYKTPAEGGGVRSWHIAREMAALGHTVRVITTWNGPVRKDEQDGAVRVCYLPIGYDNAYPRAARMRAFRAFVWQAYKEARRSLPADLVFATSTPLTIGLVALALRLLHRIPYVFEVRDLWPEAPIQLGQVRDKAAAAFYRRLERSIYARAQSLVALSPPVAEHLRGVAPKRAVHYLPNFADLDFFDSVRQAPKPAAPVRILYAGTFGYANGIPRLMELCLAAQQALPGKVSFMLVGEGAALADAKGFAAIDGLSNVEFRPVCSAYDVRDLLGQCHYAYVGFRDEAVLQLNSPNKFFDALAAGLPILLSVDGWLRKEMEDAACGHYLGPQGKDGLAILRQICGQDAHAYTKAQNATRVLAEKYNKSAVMAALPLVLEGAVPALQ